MNIEKLKELVDNLTEAAIDELFVDVHAEAKTISGDITPLQQFELDEISQKLKDLVVAQVEQNLKEEELEGKVKQWEVPVLRTSYSHTTITVSAKTEEEAIYLALDKAGDESFSENSAKYDALDGATLID